MDITQKEIEEKYIIKENHIEYQPTFTYKSYDKETETYKDVIILKTAEEVKSEYEKKLRNRHKGVDIEIY